MHAPLISSIKIMNSITCLTINILREMWNQGWRLSTQDLLHLLVEARVIIA